MEEMILTAQELGFSHACLIDTSEIPFEPAFRICCEDNLCGQYGANWSCPPECGTTEEMERKIKAYPRALVLQTMWDIDYDDGPAIKRTKGEHNRRTRELIARYENRTRGFMVGASGCGLCEVCAIKEGQPCRFPDRMASCMSAYCIYVKKLAERCGMEYDSGPGIVNFFGMYVFEEL